MTPSRSAVIHWLLESDPAIRWQVLRDLTDASADEVAAERARVATHGLGARLLALQAPDGRWGGATWNRGWDSTMHAFTLLWQMGLDPASSAAQFALSRVRDHVTWRGCGPAEADDNRYFDGEIEPCINGQVATPGAYFGADVGGIVTRLLGEQLDDGGWNCEAPHHSKRSSFNTTICVLEALYEYEAVSGSRPELRAARQRGERYLLERHLLRRLSTGAVIDPDWTRLAFTAWWHYDVLRGLDYMRRAGITPDDRLAETIALITAKRNPDGVWLLEHVYPGTPLVDIDDGAGKPSRWNTLRALRVLDWYTQSR